MGPSAFIDRHIPTKTQLSQASHDSRPPRRSLPTFVGHAHVAYENPLATLRNQNLEIYHTTAFTNHPAAGCIISGE
jgi:hypothetical protein